MTYVVGMVANEELLIVSDGLLKGINRRTQEEVYRDEHAKKIFALTGHIVAGFAGPVPHDMEERIEGLKLLIDSGQDDVESVAYAFCKPIGRMLLPLIEAHGRYLEILVAGYDTSGPKIYLYQRSLQPKDEEHLYEVNGVRDIGFRDTVCNTAVEQYTKSNKSSKELQKVAINLIKQVAKDYPDEVNANPKICRITSQSIIGL